MDQLFPVFGIALIAVALLQFGLWTGRGLRLRRLDKRKFEVELARLRAEIFSITSQRAPSQVDTADEAVPETQDATVNELPLAAGDWRGYRQFKIARLIRETGQCTSVYLVPADGQPFVKYLPGQHLTLRMSIPGQTKPAVRCYSLSEAPNDQYYRITVKHCASPANRPELPSGLVSTFINGGLNEGDLIDVKSPAGKFVLQKGNTPVVLLAGGIGITPLLSMLNFIACNGSGRECLLVYGVGNSSEHTFAKHLATVAQNLANVHVVNCFSDPLPQDRQGVDFQVKGFVSIDLLKHALRGERYEFYLCGPPAFMQSMYDGLVRWGIPDELIHYESFGPATIKRRSQPVDAADQSTNPCPVSLQKSNQKLDWTGNHENLLELLEEQGIEIEAGCRSGNCGTCQTRLLQGSVKYDDIDQIECGAGYCLPCVAKPMGAIEIDV